MKTMLQGLVKPSADLQSALRLDPKGFPFRCELSLEPLIAFWTKMSAEQGSAKGALARIVGLKEFWSLPLRITPAVLVPRPETETLVEAGALLAPSNAAAARLAVRALT